MPVRKVTQTESNNGIPRKADELLSSLGHQVDSREFQRITQVGKIMFLDRIIDISSLIILSFRRRQQLRKLSAMGDENFILTKNVVGLLVFYPQGNEQIFAAC